MGRILLLALVIATSALPVRAEDEADCEAAYIEHVAQWSTVLSSEESAALPGDLDPEDPCYAELVQAEMDALAAWEVEPFGSSVAANQPAIGLGVTPVLAELVSSARSGGLTSIIDVVAASLQLTDVPAGFTRQGWDTQDGPGVISHRATYARPRGGGNIPFFAISLAATPATAGQPLPPTALDSLLAEWTANASLRELPGPLVGDRSRWLSGLVSTSGGTGSMLLVGITVESQVGAVGLVYADGDGSQPEVAGYARLVAGRLAARSTPQTLSAGVPPSSVTFDGVIVTVETVERGWTSSLVGSQPGAGQESVTLRLRVSNQGAQARSFAWTRFDLLGPNASRWDAQPNWRNPSLGAGQLPPWGTTVGWVTFIVPRGAPLSSLRWEPVPGQARTVNL